MGQADGHMPMSSVIACSTLVQHCWARQQLEGRPPSAQSLLGSASRSASIAALACSSPRALIADSAIRQACLHNLMGFFASTAGHSVPMQYREHRAPSSSSNITSTSDSGMHAWGTIHLGQHLDGVVVGAIAVLVRSAGAALVLPLDVRPDAAQVGGQLRQLGIWDEHLPPHPSSGAVIT